MAIIVAPFTDEQVRALKEYQKKGEFHPFTCPYHSDVKLKPSKEGWYCPQTFCEWKQDWAHDFMAR